MPSASQAGNPRPSLPVVLVELEPTGYQLPNIGLAVVVVVDDILLQHQQRPLVGLVQTIQSRVGQES